jgi:hypothetical protein
MTVNDLVAKIVLETVTDRDFYSITLGYQKMYDSLFPYRKIFTDFGYALGIITRTGFGILRGVDPKTKEGDSYIEILADISPNLWAEYSYGDAPITEIIIYE